MRVEINKSQLRKNRIEHVNKIDERMKKIKQLWLQLYKLQNKKASTTVYRFEIIIIKGIVIYKHMWGG